MTHRTITITFMWQVDPRTQVATDPTAAFRCGSVNCFSSEWGCLVEVRPNVFVGHVDFDRSRGDDQHLGEYTGEPAEIAQHLKADYTRLNATREDGYGVSTPAAQVVVWLREFPDGGGPEIDAKQILDWCHPATY
jgi:hypothetical protein